MKYIEGANEKANPGLPRLALKLATGAGKTMVMAMLIAWQTLNAVRNPQKKNFTKGFLIVTPGITIKDRLRVLLPNDPESYYRYKRLVPEDMLGSMRQAKVVITNYQAFKLRDTVNVDNGARAMLEGWRGEKFQSTETDGEMLRRVVSDLMAQKNVVVINDEAHHCYRQKPSSEDSFSGEEREEVKERNSIARLWISGLEKLQKKIEISRVFDLSATPFFLRGSGYDEGILFPWTMSDFSLMDAIECGVVKLPRIPVSENATSPDNAEGSLVYRNLWKHIRAEMPKKGGQTNFDPAALPSLLKDALGMLYANYENVFELWKNANCLAEPCFVVVCNNTSSSKLVFDYIAGYYRQKENGEKVFTPGKLEKFRNFDDDGTPLARPRTLLIDSRSIESGEGLSKEFCVVAKDEIEKFREDCMVRGGKFSREIQSGKKIPESEILREVMNTVGRPGKLGESIRCVVSVSMLTEGWDANTVTHILGVRAFGTQLLCEQVVGRALRRYSYELNAEGLLDVEYSDIFGIPFSFMGGGSHTPPRPPKPQVRVCAVSPEQDAYEIRFPRVVGYRKKLPDDQLSAQFNENSYYRLSRKDVNPTQVTTAGVIGKPEDFSLKEKLRSVRENTVLMELTKRLLSEKEFRDANNEPKLYLFGQLKAIATKWYREYFISTDDIFPAHLLDERFVKEACSKIVAAITFAQEGNAEAPVCVILDAYNPTGTTRHVDFYTTKTERWEQPKKSHLNRFVLDSGWEGDFCRVAEENPAVKAYVKNQNMGFEIPYTLNGVPHKYVPDFILLVDDGRGNPDDLLHLIVEIKGFRGGDAIAKKTATETYWVPGVNRLKTFGRWRFAELTQGDTLASDLKKAIEGDSKP